MLSRHASRALSRCSAIRSCLPLQWHNINSSAAPNSLLSSFSSSSFKTTISKRHSSSSSTRWKTRQGRDSFAREARVQGLKSRAAFKLLEIDSKYKIFKKGQTVVDLGYAPGSWSQVAVERTKPGGRIVGIDIIPAQPPKGVSTIQGNFLSLEVQAEVKRFLSDPDRGRPKIQLFSADSTTDAIETLPEQSYIDQERFSDEPVGGKGKKKGRRGDREDEGKTVDVVLSDMSAPWDQTTGFWKRSLSDPYYRMMNTSGISFKDHNDSMNLCHAALSFARDTVKIGGHFVCKYYQGDMEKEFEDMLKTMFKIVHREKPKSSRSESKEAYFVALRRKKDPVLEHEESVDVVEKPPVDKIP